MSLIDTKLIERWAANSAAGVNSIMTAIKNVVNANIDSDNMAPLSLEAYNFSDGIVRSKSQGTASKTEMFATSPAKINEWVETPVKVALVLTDAPAHDWFIYYYVSLEPWFTPATAIADADGMVNGLQPQFDNTAAPYNTYIRQKGDLAGVPGPTTAPDKVGFGISLNGGTPIQHTMRFLQSQNWLHQLYRYDELGMNYGVTAQPRLETYNKYRPFSLQGILTSTELGVAVENINLTLMITAYDDATYPTLGASAARTFETENNSMQTVFSRY